MTRSGNPSLFKSSISAPNTLAFNSIDASLDSDLNPIGLIFKTFLSGDLFKQEILYPALPIFMVLSYLVQTCPINCPEKMIQQKNKIVRIGYN
jgi:hypothetical protein